jgi:hypothetical protein
MHTIERSIYSIQRLPRWIKRRELDLAEVSSRPQSPYFFLLVDYQEQVKDREVRGYLRYVEKINDLSRLEDASIFLRDLRAGNEKLIFHRVDIVRNGRRFSALNAKNIAVYRREKSLKKHVISNRITVCHSIDDLRVGDLVDVQVTLQEYTNEHPTVVKQYISRFCLEWNCLVLRQSIRVVNRSRRALVLHHHTLKQGKEKNTYVELKPQQEFERHYTNLGSSTVSKTAPDWLRTDYLQVTPVASWPQVSRFGYDIFATAAARNGDLDCSEIDRIELTGIQQVDALRIIRFVQDEIRYLCETEGIYSHTPKPPRYVLRRGAGDCKGKSNLMIELLKSIGVEANPVLVNSSIGKGLNHCKPSTSHFNHAVVRVIVDDKACYFDSTVGKQSGDFEHAAQLDFGYGLNLTAAGEDLVELPLDVTRKVFVIKHCVDLRVAGKAMVIVTRMYFAQLADRERFYIGSTEFSEVRDDYLGRAEDDINVPLKIIKPFTVTKDDALTNTLITEERYEITDIYSLCEKDELRITTNFHRALPYPGDKKFELQITAMGSVEHEIEVFYPYDIDRRTVSRTLANPCFEYSATIRAEGRRLKFHTRVTTFREVVDHDDIEQYDNDARRLYCRRDNRFRVWTQDRAPAGNSKDSIPGELTALLLWLLALGIVIVGMFVDTWH